MKKYDRKVYISGIGIRSLVGNTLKEFFNALRRGDSVSQKNPDFTGVSGELREKLIRLSVEAIHEAIADWGGNIHAEEKVTISLGSGLGYTDDFIGLPSDISLSQYASDIEKNVGFHAKVVYFSNSCCASSQAISYAADLIGYGLCNMVIAGGADIWSLIAHAGFKRLNALDPKGCNPFSADRRGISVGEGAVFFVFTSEPQRHKYGRLAGYGITSDAFDLVRMDQKGQAIITAMEQAVQMSGAHRRKIDLIVAHGTGTIQNDQIESIVLSRFFEGCEQCLHIIAPKKVIGHTGGASGAFGVLAAVGCFLYNCIPPGFLLSHNRSENELPVIRFDECYSECKVILVDCFAFGGTNIVLLLERNNGE
jgi:3-oxoacyl-[acyl-carrier-protein] synthase II